LNYNQEDLPAFFAENRVEVVCSLPYFCSNKPTLSGHRRFDKSIEALKGERRRYGTDEKLF
jgi:hypothetical protein